MKKKLYRFLFISFIVHIFLLIVFLTVTLLKKQKSLPHQKTPIQFANPKEQTPDNPLPLESYQIEPKTIWYNEPIAQTMSFPKEQQPQPIEKPSELIQENKELITTPQDLNEQLKNNVAEVQKTGSEDTVDNKENEDTKDTDNTDDTEEIKPLDTATSEFNTNQELPKTMALQHAHFPEQKEIQKKRAQQKRTVALTAEELKQRALQSLLKKEEPKQTAYAPQKIALQEYFALKEAARGTKTSVGYSVQATINNDIKNQALATYQKKFIDHLVTSYHIMRAKTNYANKSHEAYLTFNLETDEYGKIQTFAIGQSCKDPEFDNLFSRAVKYAEPFPAIPKHLQINRFKLGNTKINV